jgi:hypothetical protein
MFRGTYSAHLTASFLPVIVDGLFTAGHLPWRDTLSHDRSPELYNAAFDL